MLPGFVWRESIKQGAGQTCDKRLSIGIVQTCEMLPRLGEECTVYRDMDE